MSIPRVSVSCLVLALMIGLVAPPLAAQDSPEKKETPKKVEKSGSPVTLESIDIDPAEPGRDSLCQLKVKVRNAGEKAVTYFKFGVNVNGQSVSIYNQGQRAFWAR